MVDGGILARPPLNLLIDPNAARRKSPWEIHIDQLLDMFLEAILKSEFLDLRAAGTAALTSATIYRFKVESLFFFEKLQRERRIMDAIEPPQIVVMPFRYEVYSTTVDELFDALGRILDEIVHNDREESTIAPSLLEEGTPPNPEEYLITILSNLQAFVKVLRDRVGAAGRIKFSELIAGMPVLEASRTFILLLFSATNGNIVMDQEGDYDLMIVMLG